MSVAEDDHVIEALPPDASNHSLRVRILPRASWSDPHFLNTHILDSLSEMLGIDSVSISNEITRCLILRKCFNDLLCGPSCCRMFGHVKMNHSASFMRENNEHKQHAQFRSRYGKEVDRHQIANMIVQEGSPRLRWRLVSLRHQSGNGTFRYLDSELEQFSMNSRSAPTQIGLGHHFDKLSNIAGGPRSAWTRVPRQLRPIMFETLPLPTENGFGLDNHQSRLPILPHFPQADPKQTIHGSDLGTANRSLEDCHLLPERKILQSDLFRTSEDHEGS